LELNLETSSIKTIGKAMLGYNLAQDEILEYMSLVPRALWSPLLMKACYPETW
jgi:hypothetical protein